MSPLFSRVPLGGRKALRATLVGATLFSQSPFSGSPADAAIVDFNVPSGNTSVGANWINDATPPATGVPTSADETHIRNGGVAIMDSTLSAQTLRLGYSKTIPDPAQPMIEDPANPGTFIPDPANILPPLEVGGSGQLDWSAGSLNTGDFRIGNLYKGTVNQSGGSINLPTQYPFPGTGTLTNTNFTIGNETPAVGNGQSVYNLSGGSITMTGGANGNNGINVRHGTFNMTGGTITQTGGAVQRLFTIASTNNAVSVVNISAGTIDSNSGVRIGNNSGSSGTLNVTGAGVVMGLGGDLAIGRNATATSTMNMSAGTINIGSGSVTPRLQVGDNGPGTLNMSGGVINVNRDTRVYNTQEANGSLLNLTGGTINTLGIDTHVNEYTLPGTDLGGRILVNGSTAVFNSSSGNAIIGNRGKFTFEVQQGSATLNAVQLGQNATSAPTIIVNGGTLKLLGQVSRNTLTAAAPVMNFTGGALQLDVASGSSVLWQTSLPVDGSTLELKPGALLAANIGDATHPSVFDFNSGIWNLEIGAHNIDGADRVVVTGGAGSIDGGTINLSYLPGFTPVIGEKFRIVRTATAGQTVTLGSVSLTGMPGWKIGTNANNTEIQLTFVPEPATGALAGLGLLAVAAATRRKRVAS